MITVNSHDFDAVVKQLEYGVSCLLDPNNLRTRIGKLVVEQTNQRFYEQRDPDGKTWETLKPATIQRKHGRTDRLMDKLDLMRSIGFEPTDNGVFISSSLPSERVTPHQFGYEKKNIPQRAIFGLSLENKAEIIDETLTYLQGIF
ncbi:MAG: phage virion morphogenesis protein [Gammaproteobacteria bacterium]|nr:phage virion morphogenesis protein [Gammaproteobacteria bacterium]